MDKKSIILDELRGISLLLSEVKRDNVYSVDPKYFNSLADKILQRCGLLEDVDYNFTPVFPYKVESNYFESLPETILNKIKSSENRQSEVFEELKEIAPYLNTIDKNPVNAIPANYFETLQVKPKAKVFALPKRVRGYAAAAVVTGIMAIGSYFIVEKKLAPSPTQTNSVTTAVKDLRDEEILNFLKIRSSDNVTSTFSETVTPAREVILRLKEMTDDELQQYLRENSEFDEIEVDI